MEHDEMRRLHGILLAVSVTAGVVAHGTARPRDAEVPRPSDSADVVQGAAPEELTEDARAVLELDRQAELALPRMDVAYLDSVFADDLRFTHGDVWTGKNVPGNVNTKREWLNAIKNSNGLYLRKEANSQRIEMHGDVAIIAGRSSGRLKANATLPDRDYEIWYVRVYAKRDGRWQMLSHKTVRGPQDTTS